MQYYVLGADAEHRIALGPRDPKVWDFLLEKFDQAESFDRWTPFDLVPVSDHILDPKDLGEPGDIVNFNLTDICLLSERAKQKLAPLFERYGELLPVKNFRDTYYIYHVTKVLNALNEGQSTVERFASGKIMHVKKYVLRDDVVAGCDVFRMPTDKWRIFVSEKIVEQVSASGLTGYSFSPI